MMKDFFNGLVSARMMELDSSRSFAKARKAEFIKASRNRWPGGLFLCVTGLCWLLPIECGTLKNIRYSGVKGIGRCSLSNGFG